MKHLYCRQRNRRHRNLGGETPEEEFLPKLLENQRGL